MREFMFLNGIIFVCFIVDNLCLIVYECFSLDVKKIVGRVNVLLSKMWCNSFF